MVILIMEKKDELMFTSLLLPISNLITVILKIQIILTFGFIIYKNILEFINFYLNFVSKRITFT